MFARWLGIVFRALHLAAVIHLGAAMLAGVPAQWAATAVLVSGLALFALDSVRYPGHLGEVAGLSVVLKLVLVAAMVMVEPLRPPLFWTIIIWSVLFAHAPGSLRHRRLFGATPASAPER
jgi:hypothetical protein